MTRRILSRWMMGITASAALVIQAAVPAFADPPNAEPATKGLAREVLFPRVNDLDEDGGWLRSNFHLHKKSGFAFTHHFTMADRPFVFRIQGPVLRKQQALGIKFKIRF